jgi:hypothetical protein
MHDNTDRKQIQMYVTEKLKQNQIRKLQQQI